MFVVFQSETGGYLRFPVTDGLTVVSGYLDAVARSRKMYRFDGILTSGYLYIAKSGISNLDPGDYSGLPQVIDIDNQVYFLDQQDIQVIEVPDFFSYAVLTDGDSVLVRLTALENAQGFTYYTAGSSGVQTAKLVALDNGVVEHADCTNINHAGSVVGIAMESASPGSQVRVQSTGAYSSSLLSLTADGPGMVGTNGNIVTTVPLGAVFIQFIGVIVDSQKINLFIDTDVIVM